MDKTLKTMFMSLIGLSSTLSAEGKCDFASLSEQRHSGYGFDSGRSISKEQIIQLAETAHFAPSSYNDQPWKFIFCDKIQTPKAYEKTLQSLVEFNKEWAKNAPLLIIVLADNLSTHNEKINRFAEYDTGAAAMSLVYEATDLGLMAHQMGGYDADKIRSDFSLAKNLIPMAVIAIGYEAKDQTIKPKDRRSIEESFFLGELNKGIKTNF